MTPLTHSLIHSDVSVRVFKNLVYHCQRETDQFPPFPVALHGTWFIPQSIYTRRIKKVRIVALC